ncbi:DLA class II histocompatibility antigen, DR-1 beta chain-like, partial [Mustelus asterias]
THITQFMLTFDNSQTPATKLSAAYDGTEFIRFDYSTNQFLAVKPVAEPLVQSLNANERLIKQYIRYGAFAPLVAEAIIQAARRLIAKPSINITTHRLHRGKDPLLLICHVNGFYPSGINATWLHNGGTVQQEVLSSRILPNTGGTFQTTLQISITPQSRDIYTCQVEHSSSTDKLTATWAPKVKSWPTHGYVAGIVIGVAGIIIALAGGIGRCRGFPACGSEAVPNQRCVNPDSSAADSGVWTQGEAEQLFVENERTSSPAPAQD